MSEIAVTPAPMSGHQGPQHLCCATQIWRQRSTSLLLRSPSGCHRAGEGSLAQALGAMGNFSGVNPRRAGGQKARRDRCASSLRTLELGGKTDS